MYRRFGLLLLALAAAVALTGCSGGDVSADSVKQDEAARKAASDEMLKQNPPPPGEGPGD